MKKKRSKKQERPICEVCGKPATAVIQDVLTYLNVRGDAWFVSEPHGDPHYYCDEHKRETVVRDEPKFTR